MDHPPGRHEDSLMFTPQPAAPAMLGQRNTDSVLFHASMMEASGRPREIIDDRGGSGFVDVTSLVDVNVEGANGRPLVEPKAALVAEIELRPAAPIDTPAEQPHGLVLAVIVVTVLGLVTVAVAVLG